MVVARDLFQDKFHVPSLRKSYSRIPDVARLPHLVQIQLDSYEIFKKEGLRELLDEISPIQDFTGNRLEMRFTDYAFGEPKYSQEEARERDATYAAPLRVNVRLLVKETGEIKEQEIFMGDFPLMTEQGTFIINGAERVVVYLWLVDNVGSVRSSLVTYVIPIVGLLLGWAVLDESIGLNTVLGCALIIGGVAAVMRGEAPSKQRLAVAVEAAAGD